MTTNANTFLTNLAREAATLWIGEHFVKTDVGERAKRDRLAKIILSCLTKATEGLYKLIDTQSSPNDLRAYELDSEDPVGYLTPVGTESRSAPASAEQQVKRIIDALDSTLGKSRPMSTEEHKLASEALLAETTERKDR